MKKLKKPHVRKILHPSRKVRKSKPVVSKGVKRRRRTPSKVNSKGQDKRRAKKRVLHKHGKAVVKPRSKRKRKGVKATRLPVKVQKVSRGKKQLRKSKGGNKRVSAKPVRKVRKQVARIRGKAPQSYTPFNDDAGEKKLYKISLTHLKTFKEKRSYIERYNFWPMITEAENYIESQFPFGFMVIIQTKFKDMILDMAGRLSDIEEAIDDPALRRNVLAEMDDFRMRRYTHPLKFDPATKSDQLFKPNNIKAVIIRFMYRTNK